jgi:hypothetical protein
MNTRIVKRAVVGLAIVGCSVFGASAVASADTGGTPAISCAGVGNPADAARLLGAVGRNHFETPVDLSQSLGYSAPGDAINALCFTPGDTP